MPEAYIVDAVRTPVGKKNGGLAKAHPADLGAHVLTELVRRTGIDPAAVEDVVFGCLDTIGPQAGDIARTAWLAAGLPEEVPGTTLDRRCEREITADGDVGGDEGPRRDTTLEKMQSLKPLAEGGRITAAVSSQISDGAAAILVVSERALKEHNLTPRARVHHLSVRGADPIYMLTAPIPATSYALDKTGLTID